MCMILEMIQDMGAPSFLLGDADPSVASITPVTASRTPIARQKRRHQSGDCTEALLLQEPSVHNGTYQPVRSV
jgi:hypothetical protein